MGYIAKMPEKSIYKIDKPIFKEGDAVKVIKKQNGFDVGYIGIVTDFYIDAFSHVYYLDNGNSIQVGHLNALNSREIMATEIKINGTLVFEITSFRHWVNAFPGALLKLPMAENYIWIDSKGNSATCGQDFMIAGNTDTYPIKIYLLQRVAHTVDQEYSYKLLKHIGV